MNLPFLLLLAAFANAQPVPAARAYFSCAPWDGAALGIEVHSRGVAIRATIWGRGIEKLHQGVTAIEIDNVSSTEGSGAGSLCPEGKGVKDCRPERLSFEFSRLDVKPNGRVRGRVRWSKHSWVPFDAAIDPMSALCG